MNIAAHTPATDSKRYFLLSDGKAMKFCILCIVPIMIGLKIHDFVLYRDFIDGINISPLIDILGDNDDGISLCKMLLNENETYKDLEDKAKVNIADKLKYVYKALFVEEYRAGVYEINIGELKFTKKTRTDLLGIVSLCETNFLFCNEEETYVSIYHELIEKFGLDEDAVTLNFKCNEPSIRMYEKDNMGAYYKKRLQYMYLDVLR